VASDADLLLVFAAIDEDTDGIAGVEEAYGQVGSETCVVVRAVRGRLTRRHVPSGVATLRSRPVRMRPTLTVPDYDTARERYHLDMSGKGLDRWLELAAETAARCISQADRPICTLGGSVDCARSSKRAEVSRTTRARQSVDPRRQGDDAAVSCSRSCASCGSA
jgi:hypothetical protein